MSQNGGSLGSGYHGRDVAYSAAEAHQRDQCGHDRRCGTAVRRGVEHVDVGEVAAGLTVSGYSKGEETMLSGTY